MSPYIQMSETLNLRSTRITTPETTMFATEQLRLEYCMCENKTLIQTRRMHLQNLFHIARYRFFSEESFGIIEMEIFGQVLLVNNSQGPIKSP